jgi:hypothetical protein
VTEGLMLGEGLVDETGDEVSAIMTASLTIQFQIYWSWLPLNLTEVVPCGMLIQ